MRKKISFMQTQMHSDEDYMKAAELETVYAEYDGYTAESRAGELLRWCWY